jgi:hypothetical protein
MRKSIRITLVVVLVLASGVAGLFGGIVLNEKMSLQASLLEAAQDVWVLEKFRSISCTTPSPNEVQWMNLMIESREQLLLHPEFKERIESDRMIQSLRVRTAKIRSERRSAEDTR